MTNAVGSTTAPTVTGIALTSTPTDTAYGRGGDVEATVTFDAAVDITGTPQLELDFDGTAKAAACTAATNTTAMVCSYTVAPGDSAPTASRPRRTSSRSTAAPSRPPAARPSAPTSTTPRFPSTPGTRSTASARRSSPPKTPWPKATNLAVLKEYSQDMIRLNRNGVRGMVRPSGHVIRKSFDKIDSGGSIPSNVTEAELPDIPESMLKMGNNAANDAYTLRCKEEGIKIHPARFPRTATEVLHQDAHGRERFGG